MDRKTLSNLIDAYADAKASRNQHLVNTMVAQLQEALEEVFGGIAQGEDEPDTDASY